MVAPLEKVVPLNDPLPLVHGLYVIGPPLLQYFGVLRLTAPMISRASALYPRIAPTVEVGFEYLVSV